MKEFFKNKKILITGNKGFKGSWLTLFLCNYSKKIFGISSDNTNDYFFRRISLDKKIVTTKLDILNKNRLKSYLLKVKPKIIFHLAAEALVIKSYKSSYKTMNVNIMGLINILEILKDRKFKNITLIVVTSDKCYEPDKNRKFLEEDPLGGMDIYSASKACAEIVTKAYSYSFFQNKSKNVKIATVRAGNVIGAGDFGENRLLPDIIRSSKNNRILKIRNLKHKRPWQHVKDCIFGYLKAAEYINNKKIMYSNWNFGSSNNKIDVEYVLKRSLDFFKNIKWKKVSSDFRENPNLELNSNKSRKLLEWRTKYSIEKLLSETLKDYEILLNKKLKKEELLKKFLDDIKFYCEK